MKSLVAGLLLLSLAIGGGISLLASGTPDGLEYTMEKHQLEASAAVIQSPMPVWKLNFAVLMVVLGVIMFV